MEFWTNLDLDQGSAAAGYTLNLRARIALRLIEQWGTVAGKEGGEDTAGRAFIALMPVAEVVERAASMADLTVAELERREWIRTYKPSPEELGELQGRVEDARYKRRFADRKV